MEKPLGSLITLSFSLQHQDMQGLVLVSMIYFYFKSQSQDLARLLSRRSVHASMLEKSCRNLAGAMDAGVSFTVSLAPSS